MIEFTAGPCLSMASMRARYCSASERAVRRPLRMASCIAPMVSSSSSSGACPNSSSGRASEAAVAKPASVRKVRRSSSFTPRNCSRPNRRKLQGTRRETDRGMRRLALLLLVAVPLFGQELFPRFSITGSTSKSDFETNIRVDPEVVGGEVGTPGTGTVVNFERDLGLDDSRNLQRFGLQWSPARRHEFSATYFSAPRNGFAQIDREILFREKLYPVNAQVTSQLDLDYLSASYTYWLRRTDHDGLGLSLGAAMLSLGASVNAVTADQSVTLSESADTDV